MVKSNRSNNCRVSHRRSVAFTLCCSALLLLASVEYAFAALVRQPYLQLLTPTSVTIVWRTDDPSGPFNNSRVQYGTTQGSLGQTAPGVSVVPNSNPNVKDHFVTISGLTPGTKYFYNVGTTGGIEGGGTSQHYFVTAPPVGSATPFTVWVLGDSGDGTPDQLAVRNSMLQATGANPPEVMLHLGDVVYEDGTDAEFTTKHFNVYQDILRHTVSWPTFGNHEAISSNGNLQTGPYFEAHVLPTSGQANGVASGTEVYYSFDYGNTHFVVLDSHASSRAPGSAMLTWLQEDLAATTQKWIIAYWHHPPYTKGTHNSDSFNDSGGRLVQMRENVLPILEAGGVDLVLTGHSHNYERSYFINGAFGYGTSPNFVTPSFSTLFSNGNILDESNGDPLGDGPYVKDPNGNQGAVYVVAGHGGRFLGGGPQGQHPVHFFTELLSHGSVLVDINDSFLTVHNLGSDGVITDQFSIVKSNQQAPTVNAGPNQTISLPNSASLDGTVSDDGLPSPPAAVTTTWTKVSGPGTVTFGNANAVDTTATFSAAGTYVLRLTANDSALTSSDDITITVSSASGGTITITIEAEDGNRTAPMVIGSSSTASGGQFVEVPNGTGDNFNDATNGGPGEVSFSINIAQAGTYALWARTIASSGTNDSFYVTRNGTLVREWTVPLSTVWQWNKVSNVSLTVGTVNIAFRQREDGTRLDQIILTTDLNFVPGSTNQAPTVNAGPNQTITLPSSASLNGTVSDDGLPAPPSLTTTWSKVSGPGTVSFGNSNAVDTTATFSVDGTYVLRLTANDGALSNSDDVTTTVNPAPSTNQPPTVNAGPNQTITLPSSASLDGTVSDDGLPSPPSLTTTWSKVSGPGTVSFGNANAVDTTATFSAAGTYVLRLTANDSALTSSDDITITVSSASGGTITITIEAESGTLTAPMVTRSGTTSSGGQNVEVPNGTGDNFNDATNGGPGEVSFSINIAQAGTYALWARTIASSGTNDSFYVTRNGTLVREWTVPLSTVWQWNKVSNVSLTVGTVNIAFRQREDGTRLDQIILSSDLNFQPN